jgi:triosephosphate isomerase
MKYIFVNLKRFDVSKGLGGICPNGNPKEWINKLISETIELELGKISQTKVIYMLPEGLVITAAEALKMYEEKTGNIYIGCQGVFKDNIRHDGNFGAFTTFKPAAAVKSLGSTWTIIGHSEERKDIYDIIHEYDCQSQQEKAREIASKTVNSIINKEVYCALESKLNVLLCVGETAEERGVGEFQEQKARIKRVLSDQLVDGLKGIKENMKECEVVIGYEPIWAIGPGKVPPDGEYIEFVGSTIKEILRENFDIQLPVVYGGGLKVENALEIASLKSLDGGLVGLTKFTNPIAFEVNGLKDIIDEYMGKRMV